MQLLLTNKNGDTLDLLNSRNYFILYKANALHGVDTDISENTSPFMDGTQIESVRALPRSIELGFKIVGDVQTAINYFTSYVKSKQFVTLEEINEDNDQDITIKGVATIPPYTRMLSACEINLTIYCGQPYWEDLQEIINSISMYLDLLYFPTEGQYFTEYGRPFGAISTDVQRTINNKSDTTVGMQIEIVALGEVNSPRLSCETGEQVGSYMQLNLTLQANDQVIINTVKGNKYITINGSNTYNGEPILNYLEFTGNDWLQLETGDNTFNATAIEDGTRQPASNVYFNISYKGRYE